MNELLTTDEEIEQRIRDLFGTDERLNTAHVRVRVTDGSVHLSGFVMTEEERELAAELARSVPGVRAVVSELHALPAPLC
jgi:osmotically-inducible protein OsmY